MGSDEAIFFKYLQALTSICNKIIIDFRNKTSKIIDFPLAFLCWRPALKLFEPD
jgi:hypothetical protein